MTGHTFKRSEIGFLVLCAWNNIEPEQVPPGFGEHLNEWTAQAWNRVIKAVRKYDADALIRPIMERYGAGDIPPEHRHVVLPVTLEDEVRTALNEGWS